MTAQDAFELLVREYVSPPLKAHDFKRTRATFHRAVGVNWEVVNLQRSQFSSADRVRLTINLAVGLEILRDDVHGWADGKRPVEYKCHFRSRIGPLLTGEDVWWDLQPDTRLDVLGEALVSAIERYGIPWLESWSGPDPVHTHAENLETVGWLELGWLERLADRLGGDDEKTAISAEMTRRTEKRR